MHRAVLLLAGLLAGDVRDYSRPLDAKKLDQAAFDAETYGEKKRVKRGDDGVRVTVEPGEAETGWKTPQSLRIGGDFTITATFAVRKLPKPAQEDGAAFGLALATQNLDQPDATVVRLVEPTGADVYRTIEKAGGGPQPGVPPGMGVRAGRGVVMGMPMGVQPGGKPAKPPRKTFPARGDTVVMELRREGPTLAFYVLDATSVTPRYLGQEQFGPGDVSGVKLFATNRSGGGALDVVLRSLTVRADRITGLGTEVRTVFGEVIHGEPIAIEGGKLLVDAVPVQAQGPGPAARGGAAGGAVAVAMPAGVVVGGAMAPAPATVAAPAAAAPVAAEAPKDKDAAAKKKDEPKPKDDKAKTKDAKAPAKPAAPKKPEPKAKVPLDEVDSIEYERAFTLSGRYVGQPNLDFTMPAPAEAKEGPGASKPAAPADDVLAPPPGTAPPPKKIPKVEPKPNGIRDLHLTLAGLSASAIGQVTVNTQTDKGPAAWKLDTSGAHDAPLVLRRAGTEPWADLFLEPPAGDLKGKALTVNVNYADGQSGNATIQVEASTDPKLAFDPKAPAPALDARVYLAGDEQLFGKFEGLGEESLSLKTPWGDKLTVPLAHVVAIYMGLPEHKESSESFARRLRARGTEDLLLARTGDGEVVAIAGVAEGTEGDRLRFRFQDKTRALALKQVEGLILAARPEPDRPSGLRPTFSMAGGLTVSGVWKTLGDKTWKVETAWGQTLDLPAAEVRGVRFRGGEMTYLSDLEPSRVEETPFFGRTNPWRKDVNLTGTPIKMDGRTFGRGLAVHSRSALTFDLNGRYATFEALVGFDESAKKLGRVDCRVVADGKELYANPDLRADAPPVRLSLPVAGAERLRLVVDYGPGQDTGDRVIWANARLFRKPPPAAAAAPARTEPKTQKTGSGQ